jgi:capsular polysaccharide biosynthesis protein
MSAAPPVDPGVEREIDLGALKDAVLARWWIAVVGLVVGVAIGAAYTLSFGTTWAASAIIAPGQSFSPNGNTVVLGYLSSHQAIDALAKSETTLAAVSAKTGVPLDKLEGKGNILTKTIDPESRTFSIVVTLKNRQQAEDAANAIADYIKNATTPPYVAQSIRVYGVRLANYAVRLKTLAERIKALNLALAKSQNLSPLDRLVLVSELDAAQASQGSTLVSQTNTEQALALAQYVSRTQVIQKATSEQSVGRSRRSPVVTGGLIGLLIGALVAIAVGFRASQVRPA